jgi:tetratricopeptide (TPR) repeat protein
LRTIARIYQAQGKSEQAEPLFEQALAIYETAGEEPLQGEKSEPILKQALFMQRHASRLLRYYDQADALTELAKLYKSRGVQTQADALIEQAQFLRKKIGDSRDAIAPTIYKKTL